MDDPLRDLLGDMATSLRRIAAALEDQRVPAPPGRGCKAELPLDHSASSGALPQASDGGEAEDVRDSSDRRDVLRDFLSERGVRIKVERERDDADETLDRLAAFLGSRFHHVKIFYERLKGAMNEGRPFTLSLKGAPQDVISSTCQLATELHKIAFLEEYRYRRSPQCLLYVRPSRLPRALNFLSGGWLERYALTRAIDAARACDPDARYAYLKNPQIILPNGSDFELDVLFEVEGAIYWMELKTGDYQRYIAKYSKVSRLLGLSRDRCYIVLTEIHPASAAALSALFGMTVTEVEELGTVLSQAMSGHLGAHRSP